MSIGIDYTPAYTQGGGIGRLTRDLVAALLELDKQTAYRLFVAGASKPDLHDPLSPNAIWKPTSISSDWFARIWHRAQLPIPVELFTGSLDLFHATDFTLPPTLPSTKTIVTVHDMSYVRVPDAASPRLRAYLDQVVPRSVKRSTHVIADSEATKNDLIELYDISPDKITVLLSGIDRRYYPVDDNFSLITIRNKYSISSNPYLFSIGTIQPRKNFSRVIHALKRLRDRGYDLHLVIAGGKGWLEDEMYQTIEALNMRDLVHLIGFVDDEDVAGLYSGAECVVFPSLYEGFGFPVIEGMACGTPVITSNVSSLPEVAGDAAIMVDPYDIDAITDAIQRVLDDNTLRDRMIQAGFEQASKFTWEKSARQLHEIYMQVLAM
ncbi:MAG: glycosyltransferase family 1 protein [Phototrophicaceae bacterium]